MFVWQQRTIKTVYRAIVLVVLFLFFPSNEGPTLENFNPRQFIINIFLTKIIFETWKNMKTSRKMRRNEGSKRLKRYKNVEGVSPESAVCPSGMAEQIWSAIKLTRHRASKQPPGAIWTLSMKSGKIAPERGAEKKSEDFSFPPPGWNVKSNWRG